MIPILTHRPGLRRFAVACSALAIAASVTCQQAVGVPRVADGGSLSTTRSGRSTEPLNAREDCERWVAPSPEGDNGGQGTRTDPWATLERAASRVPDRGCTVWFEAGTYSGSQEVERRFRTRTTFRAVRPYQAILQSGRTVLDINGASNVVFAGFELRHTGPGASGLLVYVSEGDGRWAERITFRDNIFHDSFDNDLLKLHDGTRSAVIRGNIFYNQGEGEEQIDVNSATDVVIEGNIFFNDFGRSGRTDTSETKHFITVKDSNGGNDDLLGSRRISIDGNIFLNWEGGLESFVNVGNDGKPYHEARQVAIENNLMIGNAQNDIDAALSIAGAKDVGFVNNTVVGDLPSSAYAFRVYIKGSNPRNENILFSNNIWSDPTGTMGEDLSGEDGEFSNGDADETIRLTLNNNLYWNGGSRIPRGDLVDPVDDTRRVVRNPLINADQDDLIVPFWTGPDFLSGNQTIREEFVRLVTEYGSIPARSKAVGRSLRSLSPPDDILGRQRDVNPDLGAFEAPRPAS